MCAHPPGTRVQNFKGLALSATRPSHVEKKYLEILSDNVSRVVPSDRTPTYDPGKRRTASGARPWAVVRSSARNASAKGDDDTDA